MLSVAIEPTEVTLNLFGNLRSLIRALDRLGLYENSYTCRNLSVGDAGSASSRLIGEAEKTQTIVEHGRPQQPLGGGYPKPLKHREQRSSNTVLSLAVGREERSSKHDSASLRNLVASVPNRHGEQAWGLQ